MKLYRSCGVQQSSSEMATRIREKQYGGAGSRMDVRLWLRLLSCSTIVEKRLRRRLIDQFDTTLPRFDVLATLERHPEGLAMSALSQALLVSNGNVTTIVRQLEGAGHISSRPSEKDGRSSVVVLTPSGRDHFQEIASAHHGWIGSMFGGMSADQQRQLYALLDLLKASIGSERDNAEI
jgi:DNA-binding MarR family transcriptional regulator